MLRNLFFVVLVAVAVLVTAYFKSFDSNANPVSNEDVGFSPEQIVLKVSLDEDLRELVDEDLVFTDRRGVKWVAPEGTLTDGASVPRLALSITNGRFAKEFLKASIVHDAYSQAENISRAPDQYRKKSWELVHKMYYEAMIAGGTTEATAMLMYAAVWIGGPRWNDPDRDLAKLSESSLKEFYERCSGYIKAGNMDIDKLDEWMVDVETEMLAALSQ